MFVLNYRLKKAKRLFIALAAVSAALAVICACALVFSQRLPRDTAVCDAIGEYSLRAETEEQTKAFFAQLGMEADIEGSVKKEVTIPAHFNGTYQAYNELQRHAGLDLSRYCGKTVERYTIPVSGAGADYAVILVCRGRVIGGHLTNGEYGGEDLPLI